MDSNNPIVIDDKNCEVDGIEDEAAAASLTTVTHELLPNDTNKQILADPKLTKRRKFYHTKKQNNWCQHMWSEWASARNSHCEDEAPVSKNFVDLSVDEMDFWLCRFVTEVRKKNGDTYPPNTIYQICYGFQRLLRESGHPYIKLFEDPKFYSFQSAIDREMKKFNAFGDTQSKRQARPITSEEENHLWEMGLLGDHSPQVLVNTMVWQIGLHFALNSGEEHRNLRYYPSQITLVEPPDGHAYLVYKEDAQHGGWQKKPKEIMHYANENDPSRCLVRLYKLYNSKCPTDRPASAFYLQPLTKYTAESFWYSKNPIGHTPLRQVVSKLMKEAGFEGYYTSHSLKVSVPSRLLNEGIDEKVIQLIMTRTGHSSSKGIRGFKRRMEQGNVTSSAVLNGDAIDHGNAEKRMKILQEEQESSVEGLPESIMEYIHVQEDPEASLEDIVQGASLEDIVREDPEACNVQEDLEANMENIVQEDTEASLEDLLEASMDENAQEGPEATSEDSSTQEELEANVEEENPQEKPEATVEDNAQDVIVEDNAQEVPEVVVKDSVQKEPEGNIPGASISTMPEAIIEDPVQQNNRLQLLYVPTPSPDESLPAQQVFHISGGTATINNYFPNNNGVPAPSQVFHIVGGAAIINNHFEE